MREVHSHREGARESEWGQPRCALRLLAIDPFGSRTFSHQQRNPEARPGSGGACEQPGSSRSPAEKETRKRTASCATPELTLANCWLIFILMSDQRRCDLEARGETRTRQPSLLYGPAATTRLKFPTAAR